MDTTSIVVDAIEYIGELQHKLKKLNEELQEIKEEECKENAELKSSELDGLHKVTEGGHSTRIPEGFIDRATQNKQNQIADKKS
ncbi:hypothetical protein Q3G72_010880 [Acer saccharum]|nr:hypothetical protein Q3G72_010880 [Acer saccharum]